MSETVEIIIKVKDLLTKQISNIVKGLSGLGSRSKLTSKDLDKVESSIGDVGKQSVKTSKKFKGLSKSFKATGNMAKVAVGNFNKVKSSLFGLKAAIATFTLGFFAKKTLNVAASFEKFETSLITVTGSAKKAKESMDWITEFTAKTPYELSQVAEGFVKLSAYGFDATKYLKVLGDTASSMGKDLNQAVEAFADAATGEFERLKEFGIKTKTVGDDVTFSWVKNGVEMTKTVKKTQEAITTGLTDIWSDRFAGGMDRFSKTWSGMWSNMLDQFTLFQKAVMEGGVFDYLKAALSLVLDKIKTLRKEGKLDEWAKKISNSIISTFESLVIGTAGFVDIVLPLIKELWKSIESVWSWFKSLPSWVQKSGLVVAIFGGPLGKLAAVALLDIADKTIELKDTLVHTYKVVADKGYREAAKLDAKLAALRKKSEAEGGVWKEIEPRDKAKIGEAEDTYKSKLQGVIDKIKETVKAQKKQKEELLKQPSTAEAIKPTKQMAVVSDVTKAESDLKRLSDSNKYFFSQLEVLYEKGKISSDNFFQERLNKATEFYEKQRQILLKSAEVEADPSKKLEIEDEIFSLEQQHKIELINLAKEKDDIESASENKRLRAKELLGDIQQRSVSDTGGYGLTAQFEEERAEMDIRHAEELEKMTALADNKFAIEQGYMDKLTMLKDIARQQELEKDQLLADQQRKLNEMRLQTAIGVAGGIGDTMSAMYELSGKKNKEFFLLSKAAAVAEAVMTTYSNATKAYNSMASIPYVGHVLGAVAAAAAIAMGMGNVAKIRAQSLAEGGLIAGLSPTPKADDKIIQATSGEYVEPVSTVKHYGLPIMEGLKNKIFPKEMFTNFRLSMPSFSSNQFAFAEGGYVGGISGPSGVPSGPVGGKQQEIKIVNVIDPRQVLDVISSTPEGQDTILNVIDQRQTTARQILRTENDL